MTLRPVVFGVSFLQSQSSIDDLVLREREKERGKERERERESKRERQRERKRERK